MARGLKARLKNAKIVKFADVLYECHDAVWAVLERYGVPREAKSGDLLQFIGTDFGRKRDENMWVNITKRRVNQLLGEYDYILVDDCRFENEFNAFPEALKIRLEATEDTRALRAESWRENTRHPSETGLDDYAKQMKFDLYLQTENEATLEFLLDRIVVTLKRRQNEQQEQVSAQKA